MASCHYKRRSQLFAPGEEALWVEYRILEVGFEKRTAEGSLPVLGNGISDILRPSERVI